MSFFDFDDNTRLPRTLHFSVTRRTIGWGRNTKCSTWRMMVTLITLTTPKKSKVDISLSPVNIEFAIITEHRHRQGNEQQLPKYKC